MPGAAYTGRAGVGVRVVHEPTIALPSAETAVAAALTPPGRKPRSCMPVAAVQRKAREPETPAMTEPLDEMPLAALVIAPGRTPRSWMPPDAVHRKAWD